MNLDIPLTTIVDNSHGLRLVEPDSQARRRSLHLLFEEADRGRFHVRAWGDALAEDGGGAYAGWLELSRMDVHAIVDEVMRTWNVSFLGYQEPGTIGTRRYPFSDHADLTADRLTTALDARTRELARAGHKLFRALFYSGDWALKELGDAVSAALRTGPQLISVHSEDLFVPWPMLYVPPSDIVLGQASATWDPEGFIGCRHLIEHNFRRTGPGWSPAIAVGERVRAGVNVDRNLDVQFPESPTVDPLIKMFEEYCQVIVREDRQRLADDLSADDFADHFVYFGCHGMVARTDHPDRQAYLVLTDREPIYTSDFRYWLELRPLSSRPMVFINACQGGRMSSQFYTTFARIFMQAGANCLIGPQIDIPPAFAAAYASAFVSKVMTPGSRVGDIVQELAKDFLLRQGNPLGLAMLVFRGLDAHFAA